MRPYDLVAVDMDGTLLSSDRTISPRTHDALRAVGAEGTRLMLASGRCEHGLRHQAERLGLDLDGLLLSCCNGAVVCEASTDRVYFEHTLEPSTVRRVVELCEELGLTAMAHVGDTLYVTDLDGYFCAQEAASNDLRLELAPRLDLPVSCNKVLVSAPEAELVAALPRLGAALEGLAETCRSAPFYFEVNPPGVSKGAGIADFCRTTGIDLSRVIAFGDHENDITMLTMVGTGVAMGNALEHVKAVADRVTGTNDEDGIAQALGH